VFSFFLVLKFDVLLEKACYLLGWFCDLNKVYSSFFLSFYPDQVNICLFLNLPTYFSKTVPYKFHKYPLPDGGDLLRSNFLCNFQWHIVNSAIVLYMIYLNSLWSIFGTELALVNRFFFSLFFTFIGVKTWLKICWKKATQNQIVMLSSCAHVFSFFLVLKFHVWFLSLGWFCDLNKVYLDEPACSRAQGLSFLVFFIIHSTLWGLNLPRFFSKTLHYKFHSHPLPVGGDLPHVLWHHPAANSQLSFCLVHYLSELFVINFPLLIGSAQPFYLFPIFHFYWGGNLAENLLPTQHWKQSKPNQIVMLSSCVHVFSFFFSWPSNVWLEGMLSPSVILQFVLR